MSTKIIDFNGDGITDLVEQDLNNDGRIEHLSMDINHDGILDITIQSNPGLVNMSGIPNFEYPSHICEMATSVNPSMAGIDFNGDGIIDAFEYFMDMNGDGIPDAVGIDLNRDGIIDKIVNMNGL